MRLTIRFHVALTCYAFANQALGEWKAKLDADPLHPEAQARIAEACEQMRRYHRELVQEARRPHQAQPADG